METSAWTKELETKNFFVKTYVLNILLYGCEARTITNQEKKK